MRPCFRIIVAVVLSIVVLTVAGISFPRPSPVGAVTPTDLSPKNYIPAAKPADLPARLPWAAGEVHSFGDFPNGFPYNPSNTDQLTHPGDDHICSPGHAQDCYALDVINLSTSTAIYPIFGGTVAYAGCATGGWSRYGQIVYITNHHNDNHTYGVLYAHLSSVTVHTGDSIGPNQQIGTAGETVTKPDDGCTNPDDIDPNMGVHLHFAMYQDAQFCGLPGDPCQGNFGPYNGKAVIPEPLIGQGVPSSPSRVYENFQWWKGPMMALDLNTSATPNPGGWWNSTAVTDGQHIPAGQPVPLSIHVHDTVPILEVHFTAYYPNWAAVPAQVGSTSFPSDFPQAQIWRIHQYWWFTPDPSTAPLSGDISNLLNFYSEHDPTTSVVPWLPPSHPAPSSSGPVNVCIGFDIIDTAGVESDSPNGTRCVILDPPAS